MNYINDTTGTTVEVITTQSGSFKTIKSYPATTHSPAEVVTKSHRTWAGVEKRISGMRRV